MLTSLDTNLEITEKTIRQIKEDPRFFGPVYERYSKEIFGYCYYLSSNRHKAEDLTSMTFIRALEKFHSFSGDIKSLRAWLYTIARNIHIDVIRKYKKEVNVALDLDILNGESEDETNDNNMLFGALVDSINELVPPIYAEILILKYKQELSNREIAEIVNKSEENVRTIAHRAINKLRSKMHVNNSL